MAEITDAVAVARKSAGFGGAFAAALAGGLAEAAPILDERARRGLAGAGGRPLGRGGVKLVAAAMGASADTVGKGVAELEAGLGDDGRVRVKGAGRPAAERKDPGVWAALDALVDPLTREAHLTWERTMLLNICAGLRSEQPAARPLAFSSLSLLGLIRQRRPL